MPGGPEALVAVYRVNWGVSVRALMGSSSQPSYQAPPPTTVVGALAEAAARAGLLGLREFVPCRGGGMCSGAAAMYEALRPAWVTAGWLSRTVQTMVLIRYFSGPYRSHKDRREDQPGMPPSNLWAPVAVGYVAAPRGLLQVVVVPGSPEALKLAFAAAPHVSRLGSKESMVDLVYAAVCRLGEAEGGITYMPAPLEAFKDPEGAYRVERMPWPLTEEEWLCHYTATPGHCKALNVEDRTRIERPVLIPTYPGGVRVRPGSLASGYTLLEPCGCRVALQASKARPRLSPLVAPEGLLAG